MIGQIITRGYGLNSVIITRGYGGSITHPTWVRGFDYSYTEFEALEQTKFEEDMPEGEFERL